MISQYSHASDAKVTSFRGAVELHTGQPLQSGSQVEALLCEQKILYIPRVCNHGETSYYPARRTSALQVNLLLCEDPYNDRTTASPCMGCESR